VKSGIFVSELQLYSNEVWLIGSESNAIFRVYQITSGCGLCFYAFLLQTL